MTKDEALRLALEFIASINPAFTCEAIHHSKKERHEIFEPCPHVAKQKQVYEAIKAALEKQDKPMHPQLKAMLEDYFDKCFAESASKRTWVGLTDQVKQEWIDAMPNPPQPRHFMVLVNAIESELKEKNT